MTTKDLTREDWASVLGEGIHTGFRKGSEHPRSSHYWNVINDMPDELWNDVLSYLVWSLDYMQLIKVRE